MVVVDRDESRIAGEEWRRAAGGRRGCRHRCGMRVRPAEDGAEAVPDGSPAARVGGGGRKAGDKRRDAPKAPPIASMSALSEASTPAQDAAPPSIDTQHLQQHNHHNWKHLLGDKLGGLFILT